MKLILDEYKSNNFSSSIEKDIIENYIKKYDSNEYEMHLSENDEYQKIEALIQNRINVIKWYEFKKNSIILEIGAGFGELTGILSENAKEVVSVESSKVRAEAISIRYKNVENITVIACKNTKELNLCQKFDYIIIRDYIDDLKYVQKYLKSDGTIILLLNNKNALSNISSNGKFQNSYGEKSYLYSLSEIKEILENNNCTNYKFFYPLPNYYNTNVIFSDEYLPDYNSTKLINNFITSEINFSEIDEFNLLRNYTKEGVFKTITNSYLVEINPKSKEKYIGYNNFRKEDYKLITKIYDEFVKKENLSQKSKKHIDNINNNIIELNKLGFEVIDEFKDDSIYSKYMNLKTLDQIIVNEFSKGNIKQGIDLIEKWYFYINSKLEGSSKIYIDLVFENTFYTSNKFIFFDQEWFLENVPVKFILYRSINNLYIYNENIENKIKKEDLLNRFELIDSVKDFSKIEEEFQKQILDKNIESLYFKKNEKKDMQKEKISVLEKKLNRCAEELELYRLENDKKEKYIEELKKFESELGLYKEENLKKEIYIEEIKNDALEKERKIQELIEKNNELTNSINDSKKKKSKLFFF